jgi:hypothetical protein
LLIMMASAKCVLSQALRDRLQTLIDAKGKCLTAKILGLQPATLRSAVHGACIQPGTAALLELRLGARDAAGRVL